MKKVVLELAHRGRVETRRLRGVLIAVHRLGRQRRHTTDDQRWAARVIDALTVAVRAADTD